MPEEYPRTLLYQMIGELTFFHIRTRHMMSPRQQYMRDGGKSYTADSDAMNIFIVVQI